MYELINITKFIIEIMISYHLGHSIISFIKIVSFPLSLYICSLFSLFFHSIKPSFISETETESKLVTGLSRSENWLSFCRKFLIFKCIKQKIFFFIANDLYFYQRLLHSMHLVCIIKNLIIFKIQCPILLMWLIFSKFNIFLSLFLYFLIYYSFID